MIRKTIRLIALTLLFGILGALCAESMFRALNAPVERSVADLQAEVAETALIAAAEREIRMARQLEQVRPVIEYRGNYFTEGMVIEGGDITHYCAGRCCNGKWAGITADGTVLDEKTEPVVGANWLPLGSVVEFGGTQYRVADRGKDFDPVGRLDVFVPEGHQAALGKGRPTGVEITVVRLGG